MTPSAATSGSSTAGEGLAFVITSAAPQGAAAGVGLGGVGRRSVAVEFDSVLSVKHSDPNDNHVGVNVGGSPVSLASATAPLILNDAHTKHAWIHYDPTSAGTLRVFLSASRQQPSKAVLTARVSLCSALKPTIGSAAFLFGFVAANNTQRHDILSWGIVTAPFFLATYHDPPGKTFGQVASAEEVAAGSEGGSVPSTFHYASLAFHADSPAMEPSWNLPPFVSWMLNEASWPVKSQHGCGMAWMRYGMDPVWHGCGMAWMRYGTDAVWHGCGMAWMRYGTDAVWHGCGMARMRYGTDGCVIAWMRYCMDALLHGCVIAWMRYCMDALLHGCVIAWMRYGMDAVWHEYMWIDRLCHGGIADSSAYAVVAAVEAAYSIASNWSQPPRLSVEQLRVALSSNCDDMPPRDVLAFLVAATRKGGGLVDDAAAAAAAAAASPHSMASAGRRERLAAVSRSEWWVLVIAIAWRTR
ncbi:unnamed protein product [Closterium sp. Yama58-4]|nr:unnamed protein product [Closterium sp. Yama58-4]